MWLVHRWGQFVPCWNREETPHRQYSRRQCVMVKWCQCACSSTVRDFLSVWLVFCLRGTLTPVTHFQNSFSIMFFMPWARCAETNEMKNSRNLQSPVSEFFFFFYSCRKQICILQNLLAFVWRSLYESIDLMFSRCCFLSLFTRCSTMDPRGSDYLSCICRHWCVLV